MQRGTAILLFVLVLAIPPLYATAAAQPQQAIQVDLYITTRCPWCTKAIAYLQEKGIPYTLHDVEKDQAALQRFLQINPRGGVPFAVIGEQRVLGFDPQAYGEALGLQSP